jgi:transposase
MKANVTYSVGNLAVIDKADGELGGYLKYVFGGIGGKARDFVPMVKLFMYNRMGDCLATNRLTTYPEELFTALGFENIHGERSFYRMIERVGKNYVFVLEQHQKILKEHNLVTEEQFFDFSSSYFEGRAEAFGELGYSRDSQPGKKQIVFGISTGINNIPTALTIQKGNMQDKEHFRFMLKTAEAVLEPNSMLIFDCGANSKKNKGLIRKKGFHYLTLKPKKVETYRKYVRPLGSNGKENPQHFSINERDYFYLKKEQGGEYIYIFFCPQLLDDQLRKKEEVPKAERKRQQAYSKG